MGVSTFRLKDSSVTSDIVVSRLVQHYRSLCFFASILVGLLVLWVGWMAILASERAHLVSVQGRAGLQLALVAEETRQIHAHLKQNFGDECSEENLNRLRGLLLNYRYIRSVGILDPQGQMLCSTSHGRLATPLPLPAPDLIDAEQTHLWMNFPIKAENQVLVVSLSGMGPFVTMVDSHVTADTLRNSDVDALWLNHRAERQGESQLIWTGIGKPTLQPPINTKFRYSSEQHHWSHQDWRRGKLIVGSNIPNTGLFIQSYRDWRSIVEKNGYMLLGLGLLAVLSGIATGLLLAQRLRRMTTLEYRIDRLCRPEHIVCMYQPIVDLTTGCVAGCEVLMRLRDGDEIIFPDRVIPLIMEKKLGWALDRAVSERALRELSAALPATKAITPFKVALNFFPENIRYHQLQELLQPLQNERIALNVEVTEYGMSEDLFDDVAQLREEHYLISVDDFGTGYSNLGTVKRLSPDFLKIDRSFVFDMEDESLRSSLIPEIVAIANAVRAEVIAEGVENEKQASRLKHMGVRYGQGYWFGRPAPLADFLLMLAAPPKIIPD